MSVTDQPGNGRSKMSKDRDREDKGRAFLLAGAMCVAAGLGATVAGLAVLIRGLWLQATDTTPPAWWHDPASVVVRGQGLVIVAFVMVGVVAVVIGNHLGKNEDTQD